MVFDLKACARSNILALQPYRCARDDYKDDGNTTLLDANENAHGPSLSKVDDLASKGSESQLFRFDSLNRYPDPHQIELKQLLCHLRQSPSSPNPLTPANLFVGVGSDEAIDALIRCFCVPGVDRILICPPTYGMYTVASQINDVEVVKIPLDIEGDIPTFDIRPGVILEKLRNDSKIKLVYICSPGNPTGKLIPPSQIRQLLEFQWNGVVVLDEAYIDFAGEGKSLAHWVNDHPNLVVMQTLSKAFGMAGIRLGFAFAPTNIIRLLNNLKAPYNISSITSALAIQAVSKPGLEVMAVHRNLILEQRTRIVQELVRLQRIGKLRGGFDANFLLVEILNGPKDSGGVPDNISARRVYKELAETKGIVVRYRGDELGCEGCLRITVGTEDETTKLIKKLDEVFKEI
ncbi:histidinol-phosphate transaminase [Orbilia ellipsospora]|uniref:histidinol-phosphate transaminase n=1 Tax=Orbilia ellipsospora TaxID=2528407 RepID=A0AAV9X6X8_9PEZI